MTWALTSMRVDEYIRDDGSNPYQRWFERLDHEAAAKVARARARLELGNTSSVESIGGWRSEYKIDWGPGYRIYLVHDGPKLIVLFGGGTKPRQQADIKQARILLDEYKARKKAEKKLPRRRR
jgi:putative addiction module killer protein